MELPALLPKELKYISSTDDDATLFNYLVQNISDFVPFFEYACDDETWSESHSEFMRMSIEWLTESFFADKLLMSTAQRMAKPIREHYSVLRPFISKNLIIKVEGREFSVNSLLWGTSSEPLREMIRRECRDNNTRTLFLPDLSLGVFSDVGEFVKTGRVNELWSEEQHEVLAVQRQASEWELSGLMLLCENILARYITRGNVIETLMMAHEARWEHLKTACLKFVNELKVGVHLEPTEFNHLSLEFLNFREDALEIFEALRFHLTHLVCAKKLTEDASFSDVINRCPHLICLDISYSNSFSSHLLDIPEDLEEINVSKCAWLTDKNLRKLINICPNLKKISLGHNQQITYVGWGVLREWTSLEKLDITNCFHVEDRDFTVILQACRHVNQLFLGECTGLSDNAFYEVAKMVPHLYCLNISRCQIYDSTLVDLAVRCQHLEVLDLTGCPYLTEKGIREAVRNAPNLRVLNITKCAVPSSAVLEIKKIRSYLDVVV